MGAKGFSLHYYGPNYESLHRLLFLDKMTGKVTRDNRVLVDFEDGRHEAPLSDSRHHGMWYPGGMSYDWENLGPSMSPRRDAGSYGDFYIDKKRNRLVAFGVKGEFPKLGKAEVGGITVNYYDLYVKEYDFDGKLFLIRKYRSKTFPEKRPASMPEWR